MGKQSLGRAEDFTLAETWRMLMNGHMALGTPTGRIAAGMEADLVVWDLQQPNTAPANDPLAAIIYSAESRNVRDVLVQGRFLKRNFRVESMDTAQAVAQARAVAERIRLNGPGRANVTY